jgi:hypothetical protein
MIELSKRTLRLLRNFGGPLGSSMLRKYILNAASAGKSLVACDATDVFSGRGELLCNYGGSLVSSIKTRSFF